MFEKLEDFFGDVLKAVKALLGKVDAVAANTAPVAAIQGVLTEAYNAYQAAQTEAAEAREALAGYFSWLIGPDYASILTSHRRMTDKDALTLAAANGWTYRSYVDDATTDPPKLAWDLGQDVVVIVNGPDGQPISEIPESMRPGEYRLRVELSHEAATRAGLTDHKRVWVPLKFFMGGCDLLSFDKKVLLVLKTAVAAETFTRKDADVFGELVVVKPMKDEHRLYQHIVLTLVGIRETETQPNVLAEVQEPAWVSGGSSFLWWLVDYITDHNIRGYGDCTLPDDSTVLGTEWTTALKIRIFQHLCELADRIYVNHHFEPAWERRALEHKTITDAIIKDCLWDHLPPTGLATRESFWRERADQCILSDLRKRRRRGDIDLKDIHGAFGKDLLFQWMDEAERIEQENQMLEWWLWRVYVPRIDRVIFNGGRGYSFGEVAKMVMSGLGEHIGAEEADFLAGLMVQFAWLCPIGDFLASVGRMEKLHFSRGEIAEEARKAYIKGDISSRELAALDTSVDWSPEERGAEDDFLEKMYEELREWFDYFLSDEYREEVQGG